VPNEAELLTTAYKLAKLGIEHTLIEESDAPWTGQKTAIGCAIVTDRTAVRKVVSNLSLLK
jgi:methylthioribose-1-phosphate isomerase